MCFKASMVLARCPRTPVERAAPAKLQPWLPPSHADTKAKAHMPTPTAPIAVAESSGIQAFAAAALLACILNSEGSSQAQEELLHLCPTAFDGASRLSAMHNSHGHCCARWRRRTIVGNRCVAHIVACLMQPALQVQRPIANAKVCTFAGSGLWAPDIDAMPAVRWQVCSAHISDGLGSPRPPAGFGMRGQGRHATHLGGHCGKVYALSDVDGRVQVADL
jgi:hypothetical protein